MGSRLSAPGPQEKRFAAYIEGLANAAGHEDRHVPLKNYCKGLLLPGERKSIEPMAARLDPENVQPMRQSLHHLVAKAPWSDETLLDEVRNHVLPAMQEQGPVVAWIVDDTGFPKKGEHSVGVARQYCGQVSLSDHRKHLPDWDLALPLCLDQSTGVSQSLPRGCGRALPQHNLNGCGNICLRGKFEWLPQGILISAHHLFQHPRCSRAWQI